MSNSSTAGVSPATTDAIIEELKLLAKSMLETSKMDTQKRHSEVARLPSYDEIIASFKLPPNLHPDYIRQQQQQQQQHQQPAGNDRHVDPHHDRPARRYVEEEDMEDEGNDADEYDDREQPPITGAQAYDDEADYDRSFYKGDDDDEDGDDVDGDSQDSADRQRSGAGQQDRRQTNVTKLTATHERAVSQDMDDQPPYATESGGGIGHGDANDDDPNDEPSLHYGGLGGSTAGDRRRHHEDPDRRGTSHSQSSEPDDGVFDGVRTQILFRSADRSAYKSLSESIWAPERVLRRHGSLVSDKDDDDDADDDENDGESESASQNQKDDASDETMRLYRVPSFPFGGGITDDQLRSLQSMFAKTMKVAATQHVQQPKLELITHKQFTSYNYEECAQTAARRSAFKPSSPYEFVMEIERNVMFEAVKARVQRRREFQKLVKENKAPVTMGTFNLRVVMDPVKTGFEEEKEYPIVSGAIIADRYKIIELLGKATFSRAIRCYDLHQPLYEDDQDDDSAAANGSNPDKHRKNVGYAEVCLKIINNTKEFFDQSLDEIRLLTLINKQRDPDDAHVVRLIDSFYYKEHTILVTELLSDNLYEYAKFNREKEKAFYFTLPRLQSIAHQILTALSYVHSLNLIHTDLKPENILFVSHRRCIVKVIDFGSSCFLSDHLSSYIQSRSYRAPEVVLGCDYDGRIDVWSLGAILVELVTGDVLFTSETVPEMLARIVYVCGSPLPRRMLWEGRHTCTFINKFGCIYETGTGAGSSSSDDSYYVFTPVHDVPSKSVMSSTSEKTTEIEVPSSSASLGRDPLPYSVLRQKLAEHNVVDELFTDFIAQCLTLDHKKRPTSAELLQHPFISTTLQD